MGVASSAVALLLVLDFSGSMQQVLSKETKARDLQNQARALLSTVKQDESVQTVVFGANPRRGCADIESRRLTPAKSWSWIEGLHPGEFGKTPLAQVLWNMRSWSRDLRRPIAVVMTDGTDTCGKDACQALGDLEKSLAQRKQHLTLILLGYDLKSEAKSFECFKKVNSPFLEVRFSSALQAWDLQKELGDSLARELSADLLGGAQGSGEAAAADQGKKGAEAGKESAVKSKPAIAEQKTPGPAVLRVDGAEARDHFVILQNGSMVREWYGGLPTDLPAGDYQIKYENPNGKSVRVSLAAREQRGLALSDFFVKSASDVILSEAGLGFELTPDARTSLIHRNPKPLLFHAQPGESRMTLSGVPLGQWKMKVVSPPWLKGRIPDQDFNSSLSSEPVFLDENLRRRLIWVRNDHPEMPRVIEFRQEGDRTETHFLPQGVRRFPVYSTDRWRWLR